MYLPISDIDCSQKQSSTTVQQAIRIDQGKLCNDSTYNLLSRFSSEFRAVMRTDEDSDYVNTTYLLTTRLVCVRGNIHWVESYLKFYFRAV